MQKEESADREWPNSRDFPYMLALLWWFHDVERSVADHLVRREKR